MTGRKLRLLADSLEYNFMTEEDRKGWISDLRGHAKSVDEAVMLSYETVAKMGKLWKVLRRE